MALAGLLTVVAHAGQVYRWTDAEGVTHYGDHQPQSADVEVSTVPVFVEPAAIARLRIESHGGVHYAWADNRLAGPIEVMVHFAHRDNTTSQPALPARATVAAGGSAIVALLRPVDPARAIDFKLRMDSLPGNPSAAPHDVEYVLPLSTHGARIDQGYGGSFSHRDQENRHAVDFATPIGTPVLAARDGRVMQVEAGFDNALSDALDNDDAGLDRDTLGSQANFIRILHEDGTMTLYAHLKPGGVLVRVGQQVRAGQQIGLSGNTGFSTGPHLHFVVQVNRGMRLQSLPFRMNGPAGPLQIDGPGQAAPR